MAARGRLITVEGVDGAGKTTLAAGLVEGLRGRAVPRVEVLREPGGVALAERVRALVTDPDLLCGSRAEALLYAAARAQLVEERLEPLLEGGAWVVLDRFVDSSLAYQGTARGLGVEEVRALNAFATGGLAPDRTLLLEVALETGRARLGERGGEPDRLEREAEAFFASVAEGYAALATADPARVRRLDAAQPPAAVLAGALDAVADLLP